ncbi:hypothetical protein [Pseudorhodoplanes sinuspersici]|nr:hypothetical protein [Pseudorhodoplanes sinuspersici]RKE69440.1 hypothetical protein DFP91_3871 [Pseudorhodoplanes sinuspersici]
MRLIALVILLASTQTALATGGFSCSIDDKVVNFEAAAVVSHSVGEQIPQVRAELEIRAPGTPDDLRKLDLSEHVTQKWYYDRDLKLRFYREREGDKAHGYVELVIQARRKKGQDETSYSGNYVLMVHDLGPAGGSEGKTTTRRGRVACSGE